MNALKLLQKLNKEIPNTIWSLVLDDKKEKLQIQACDNSKIQKFGIYTLDEEDLKEDIDKLVNSIKEIETKR